MITENYEQEIDLKDLFFSILYRWRVLLLAAVIGAMAFGGYKDLKGKRYQENIVEEGEYEVQLTRHDKEKMALEKTIENIEKSIEEQNKYIMDAPIMQINPYCESVSVAEVLIESEDIANGSVNNLLKSYEYALQDGEYTEDIAKEYGIEQRYLKELLVVDGGNGLKGSYGSEQSVLEIRQDSVTKGILRIKVVGEDRQITEGILSAVLEEMGKLQTLFNTAVGKHTSGVLGISTGEQVDMNLLEKQQNVRNNVAALQNSLTEFNRSLEGLKVPENVSEVGNSINSTLKYGLMGFVGGGFVAAFLACVIYILNDKVISDKEIINRYRLKSLGAFSKISEKRVLGFVDNWLHRLAGDDKMWPEDAIFEMIVTNVRNYAGNKKSLFVTGLASQELLDRICCQLRSMLPDIKIESEKDMIANASARRSMVECEGIVLVEERGLSRYSGIQQELEVARNVGVEVVGVIVG